MPTEGERALNRWAAAAIPTVPAAAENDHQKDHGPFSRRLGPSPQGWCTSGKSPLRIAQVYGPGNKMPEVLGDMLKSVRALKASRNPMKWGSKTGLEARCSPGRPKPTTPLNGGSLLGRP
jgi:hypothetical protein